MWIFRTKHPAAASAAEPAVAQPAASAPTARPAAPEIVAVEPASPRQLAGFFARHIGRTAARPRPVQVAEPRDPVAYPRYPLRIPGAARKVYHVETETLDRGRPTGRIETAPIEPGIRLPQLPPRRAAVRTMPPPARSAEAAAMPLRQLDAS